MSPAVAVVAVLVALVAVGSGAEEPVREGPLGFLRRSLERCGQRELGTCLRLRAVGLLDRALRSGPLQLNDYLTLTPDPAAEPAVRAARALSEDEIEAALPLEPEARDQALDEIIWDKLTAFFKSRTVKFDIPAEEGRKKDRGGKKGGGMGMIMMVFGSMMIQAALAKIALLAGKALLIGKLALVLSGIIGLKKLVGGGGGESHQVVYSEHGGHGWGRASSPEAHELAYSAQARASKASQ